jgi:hypothetical protein
MFDRAAIAAIYVTPSALLAVCGSPALAAVLLAVAAVLAAATFTTRQEN